LEEYKILEVSVVSCSRGIIVTRPEQAIDLRLNVDGSGAEDYFTAFS
jgi:hypothetical protein